LEDNFLSKNNLIQSETLNTRVMILSILGSSMIFTVLFAAFFRLIEGSDWFFISGGWVSNLILLFAIGLFLTSYYFMRDYKRFQSLAIEVDENEIHFYGQGKKYTFLKSSYYDLKFEKQLFSLFKYTKIIFIFKKINQKRKNYQSILVKTNEKDTLLNILKEWTPNKKVGKK